MREVRADNLHSVGEAEAASPPEAQLSVDGIAKTIHGRSFEANSALKIPEDFAGQLKELLLAKRGRLHLATINRRFFGTKALSEAETAHLANVLASMDFMAFDADQGCFVSTEEPTSRHTDKYAGKKPRKHAAWEDFSDPETKTYPELNSLIGRALGSEDKPYLPGDNFSRGAQGRRRRHRRH